MVGFSLQPAFRRRKIWSVLTPSVTLFSFRFDNTFFKKAKGLSHLPLYLRLWVISTYLKHIRDSTVGRRAKQRKFRFIGSALGPVQLRPFQLLVTEAEFKMTMSDGY